MATQVDPPNGVKNQGKHYFSMWQTLFEIDTEYVSITPIGRGASGVVCSSVNKETDERVAINKIHNVFEVWCSDHCQYFWFQVWCSVLHCCPVGFVFFFFWATRVGFVLLHFCFFLCSYFEGLSIFIQPTFSIGILNQVTPLWTQTAT